MVNNVLVEVYDGGGIEQVCQEEREKRDGWTEEADERRQVDLKMGTLKHRSQVYLYFGLLKYGLVVG